MVYKQFLSPAQEFSRSEDVVRSPCELSTISPDPLGNFSKCRCDEELLIVWTMNHFGEAGTSRKHGNDLSLVSEFVRDKLWQPSGCYTWQRSLSSAKKLTRVFTRDRLLPAEYIAAGSCPSRNPLNGKKKLCFLTAAKSSSNRMSPNCSTTWPGSQRAIQATKPS